MRFSRREFIRCEVRGNRNATRCCVGVSVRLLNLKVRAVFTDAEGHSIVNRDGVDAARIDFAEVVDDAAKPSVVVIAEVEAVQPIHTLRLALGDAVKIVFHTGREVVLDEIAEMFFEKPNNRKSNPTRDERLPPRSHIATVDDGRDYAGECRRSTDTEFLKGFHKACLRVPRRRGRLVTVSGNVACRQNVARFDRGQLRFIGVLRVAFFVTTFFIREEETAEGDDRSAGRELDRGSVPLSLGDARPHNDGGGLPLRISHLRGNRSFPDQLVKTQFRSAESGLQLCWCAKRITGGPDGLVRFLCVFRLGRVDARFSGKRFGAVERSGLGTRSLDSLVRQCCRIRTHIGDVPVFVERLSDTHCLAGTEPELASRFLLKR